MNKKIEIIKILSAVFLMSVANFVSAQTLSSVQKQALIAQIQQQIDSLNQQLNNALSQTQGDASWCYTFNSNLGFAQSGTDDVVSLHTALQKENISYAPDGVDVYSDGTSLGVIAFQKKYGISPQSGFVGIKTRAELNALYSCANQVAAVPAEPSAPIVNAPASSPSPLSGSLSLALNSSYPSQSVAAPQTKFKLADFTLTNKTSESVNINKIEADLSVGSNIYIANEYISNLYMIYGTNQTAISIISANQNYWTVNFNLPVNQSTDISVYGDINSLISLNSVVAASLLVSGTSAISGTAVSTNSGAVLPGQNITFGASSLTVSQDSSTPASRIVAANQRIIAGKFQFESESDSYNISELKFIIPVAAAYSAISDAILSDSSTQDLLTDKPVVAISDSQNYIFDFNNLNIPVSINSSKYLTISYDLNEAIGAGSAGVNIAPVLSYVKAQNSVGIISDGAAADFNDMVSSYKGIVVPPAGVTVNALYAFKSIPTFTAAPTINTNVSDGSDVNLYTFSVSADKNGDVAIKQLAFNISLNDPNSSTPYLNQFTFFKGSADYTPNVAIGNEVSNNGIASYIELESNGGVGLGMTNNVVVNFKNEEIIPAGQTQTYTLRAYANRFTGSSGSNSDSVSTYIESDSVPSIGAGYLRPINLNVYDGLAKDLSGNFATVGYNLLWSDKSAISHNDSSNAPSNDWYDGFEVSNLPLATVTVAVK